MFSCAKNLNTPLSENTAVVLKEGINLKPFNESTPLVLNGELYLFFNDRDPISSDAVMKIEDSNGVQEIIATNHTLGCVVVVNNEIIAFGTTLDYGRVDMFRKINGIWVASPIIYSDNGERLFNTSVTATDSGYLIAYETDLDHGGNFTFKFATSSDLNTWNKLPYIFDRYNYTACPTIRYIDGEYFVTYLSNENGKFITRIAKSIDLSSWEISPIPVLTPDSDEGNNTSDLDFVEYKGQTIMYYIIGDQLTWGYLRRATYPGSLKQFLNSFF